MICDVKGNVFLRFCNSLDAKNGAAEYHRRIFFIFLRTKYL